MSDAQDKVSSQFAARLSSMDPSKKVHAVVLLRRRPKKKGAGKRRSGSERRATAEVIKSEAKAALPEVDAILKRFGGKRLARNVTALGSIPVEIEAGGISSLAACDSIKAILENQRVFPLPRPKR